SLTGLIGRGPSSSSTRAAGCQYLRISVPAGVEGPIRVIRSFCSWLIMAADSFPSRTRVRCLPKQRACELIVKAENPDPDRPLVICSIIDPMYDYIVPPATFKTFSFEG